MSAAVGRSMATVLPERAVGGRDGKVASPSRRAATDGMSGRSRPAAAIICGLRGLEVVLAKLPFLEC